MVRKDVLEKLVEDMADTHRMVGEIHEKQCPSRSPSDLRKIEIDLGLDRLPIGFEFNRTAKVNLICFYK